MIPGQKTKGHDYIISLGFILVTNKHKNRRIEYICSTISEISGTVQALDKYNEDIKPTWAFVTLHRNDDEDYSFMMYRSVHGINLVSNDIGLK